MSGPIWRFQITDKRAAADRVKTGRIAAARGAKYRKGPHWTPSFVPPVGLADFIIEPDAIAEIFTGQQAIVIKVERGMRPERYLRSLWRI